VFPQLPGVIILKKYIKIMGDMIFPSKQIVVLVVSFPFFSLLALFPKFEEYPISETFVLLL